MHGINNSISQIYLKFSYPCMLLIIYICFRKMFVWFVFICWVTIHIISIRGMEIILSVVMPVVDDARADQEDLHHVVGYLTT